MWVLTPRMDLISAIFLSTYFFPIGSTSAISLGENPSNNNLSTSPLRPLSNRVRIDSFEAVFSKLIAIRIFGSKKGLAEVLGVHRSLISKLPEELPTKYSDRTVGAAIRLGRLSCDQLSVTGNHNEPMSGEPFQHGAERSDRRPTISPLKV